MRTLIAGLILGGGLVAGLAGIQPTRPPTPVQLSEQPPQLVSADQVLTTRPLVIPASGVYEVSASLEVWSGLNAVDDLFVMVDGEPVAEVQSEPPGTFADTTMAIARSLILRKGDRVALSYDNASPGPPSTFAPAGDDLLDWFTVTEVGG